jgi:hypothetical protein
MSMRTRRAVVTGLLAFAGVGTGLAPAGLASDACVLGPPPGWSAPTAPVFPGNAVGSAAGSPTNIGTTMLAVPDAANVLLESDGSEIYRSANGGCSWTPAFDVTSGLGAAGVDPPDPNETLPWYVSRLVAPSYPSRSSTVYAVLEPNIYAAFASSTAVDLPFRVAVSLDAGVTWRLQPLPPPSARDWPRCNGLWGAAVASSDPRVLYVDCDVTGAVDGGAILATGGSRANSSYVYRSADSGATWTLTTPVGPLDPPLGLAVDPTDAKQLWAYQTSPVHNSADWTMILWHSRDAGAHWSSQTVVIGHVPANGLSGAPNAAGFDVVRPRGSRTTRLIAWLGAAGVFQSTNGGGSWKPLVRVGSSCPCRGVSFVTTSAETGDVFVLRSQQLAACARASGALTLYVAGDLRRARAVPVPRWGPIAAVLDLQAVGGRASRVYARSMGFIAPTSCSSTLKSIVTYG